MALLSDLVRTLAAVEGLEEVSVGIFARHAREAGLISQGGRGRSAAKMTITDAANLVIAVNGCSLAKEVSTQVHAIRESYADKHNSQTTVLGVGKLGCKFGDDLERIISCFVKVDGARQWADALGATQIRFFRPYTLIDVEMNPLNTQRTEKIRYGINPDTLEPGSPDRWDETVITHRTLRAVAEAL